MDIELEYKDNCRLYKNAMEHFHVDFQEFIEAALAGEWNMQLIADLDDVSKSINNEWENPEENDPWFGCTEEEKKLEVLRIEHELLKMSLENIYKHKAEMVRRGEEDEYQSW